MAKQKFRKPTMKDVAQAAGVSATTVSHVLNATRYVSPEVTGKVNAAIAKLHFRSNPIARNLRSGKSQIIGYIMSNLENYFYTGIARGVKKTVEPLGYQLVLADSHESQAAEIKAVETFYLRGLDGLVIAPTTADCHYLQQILPADFPLVLVDRQPLQSCGDCVLLDNQEAGYTATRHLLQHGYRKIAFLAFYFGGEGTDFTMIERSEGYQQALREKQMKVEQNWLHLVPGEPFTHAELLQAQSYAITQELLANSVDAVLCGNSLAAIGVYNCLRTHRRQIPQDVALLSFDNDLWLSLASPKITSMAQPVEKIGITAAQQLLRRIAGQTGEYQIIRLPAQLIRRSSC